jgi:hypothetical protein
MPNWHGVHARLERTDCNFKCVRSNEHADDIGLDKLGLVSGGVMSVGLGSQTFEQTVLIVVRAVSNQGVITRPLTNELRTRPLWR